MLRGLGQIAACGGAGAGGAALWNDPSLLDELLQATAPTQANSGSTASHTGEMTQLAGMVGKLSDQVERMDQTSRQIVVATNQPSTVMGMETWKLMGLLTTAGTIYCKVRGYEIRDFVYVTRRHFNQATQAMTAKMNSIETSLSTARKELLARIGIVDSRIAEASQAMQEKLSIELDRVNSQISSVDNRLVSLSAAALETNTNIDLIKEDISATAKTVIDMSADLEAMRDQVSDSGNDVRDRMDTLAMGLAQQSKGIGLLCEFVCQTQSGDGASTPTLLQELRGYANQSHALEDSQTKQNQLTGGAGSRRAVLPSRSQ